MTKSDFLKRIKSEESWEKIRADMTEEDLNSIIPQCVEELSLDDAAFFVGGYFQYPPSKEELDKVSKGIQKIRNIKC